MTEPTPAAYQTAPGRLWSLPSDRPAPTVLFVDVETVRLDPAPGTVWEIAWAPPFGEIRTLQVVPDLRFADQKALDVGGFGTRWRADRAYTPEDAGRLLADLIGSYPHGVILAGSNPWFDQDHLARLPGLEQRPWYHHPVDVPAVVAGALGLRPPHRLKDAAAAAGIDLDGYRLHEAAEDVRLTRDLWRLWADRPDLLALVRFPGRRMAGVDVTGGS